MSHKIENNKKKRSVSNSEKIGIKYDKRIEGRMPPLTVFNLVILVSLEKVSYRNFYYPILKYIKYKKNLLWEWVYNPISKSVEWSYI